MDVSNELRKRLEEQRETTPWAYEAFIEHLDTPAELTTDHQALVVLSHEERDQDGHWIGMSAENAMRVRQASQQWLSIPATIGHPRFVILSSTEAADEMREIALDGGVPAEYILTIAGLPLKACNSGQQMEDLRNFLMEEGLTRAYVLSSYYHMVRCFWTAFKYFDGTPSDIVLTFGYIMWPPEEELADPGKMDALLALIEQEVEKVRKYCPPPGVA